MKVTHGEDGHPHGERVTRAPRVAWSLDGGDLKEPPFVQWAASLVPTVGSLAGLSDSVSAVLSVNITIADFHFQPPLLLLSYIFTLEENPFLVHIELKSSRKILRVNHRLIF